MKTISIVRGNRENVVNFYKNFRKSKVRYISGSFKPNDFSVRDTANFKYYNLPYYYPLGFDPASILKQKGNLSIIKIKDLEKYLDGSDLLSVSDTYYFPNLQAIEWASKHSVPVVTVVWCTIPHHITSWIPPYSYITGKTVKNTSLFIARSLTAGRFLKSIGVNESKIQYIYKGVDLTHFYPGKKKDSESINILFTGNLSYAKGLDDLLDAYLSLRKKYPKLNLIVAGSGEMEVKIAPLMKEGLVDYRGFVNYQDLGSLYREADIYCAPSKVQNVLGIRVWEEYFSYSLMEAQASGLPIVSTLTGGIKEEVGESNLLVNPGDSNKLAKALETLIKDRRRRLEVGLANRERAEDLFDAHHQSLLTEEAMLSLT